MTKLSIIIPIYNEEDFLRRCLNSFKAKPSELEEVEIICIDDGSTDSSAEILKAYEDKLCFRCFYHSTNWGVSMTRNHGITLAKGDYIAFLDSDDAIFSEGIGNILKTIGRKTDNVIQFNHYRCGEQGCKVEARYYCAEREYTLKDLPPKWAPVWNKIYKRSFLMDHCIRFPEGQQFDEDRQFNLKCLHFEKKLVAVSLPVIMKYFDNEGSICHTMTREKFHKAIDALNKTLLIETDPQMCEIIKRSITQHLESKNFKHLFGGQA